MTKSVGCASSFSFSTRYKFLNSFQFSDSMKHDSINMTSYRLREMYSPDSHCLPLTLRHCVCHKSEIRWENEVRVWKTIAKQLLYCGKFISQKLLLISMGLIIQRWDMMKSQWLLNTERVTPEKVTKQFQIIDIYPESDSQTIHDLYISDIKNFSSCHTWFVEDPLCWRPSSNPGADRLYSEGTAGPFKFPLGKIYK